MPSPTQNLFVDLFIASAGSSASVRNFEKTKNRRGAKSPFTRHSSHILMFKKSYVYTMFGKKKDVICCRRAFTRVALTPRKTGTRKPFVFNVKKNNPAIKPIIVRKSALRPSGEALRISRNKPEKKPFVSPINEPR